MRLSPNFTLAELTVSETAARRGIDNTPTVEIIENLKRLAEALQEVRRLLGNKAILVSSGYRSPELNVAVGGSKNSDHCKGLAADFIAPSFGSPDDVIKAIVASDIPYKQVIREFDRWVHFAIPEQGEQPRKQALIIDRTGTRTYA
jgi:zinc D-Ala-D-Ala carboxypeptidase